MRTFYVEALTNFPSPGCGCHPHILRAANYGNLSGLSPQQIFSDIRQSIPHGKRRIGDKEITEAIQKSFSGGNFQLEKPEPIINDGKAKLQYIINQSVISDDADVWEDSPVRIDWTPEEDTVRFLAAMFMPGDWIFIGQRESPGIIGRTIRMREDWLDYFKRGGKTAPFIIINPLDGKPAKKKTGDGVTYRSDENVAAFRHCLVEFDNIGRAEQIRFWMSPVTKKLNSSAITDTAGKSLHGWIKTPNIETLDDWRREIRGKLYRTFANTWRQQM